MEVVRGSEALERPPHRAVTTIGNFDGLHVGHPVIESQLVEVRKEIGLRPEMALLLRNRRAVIAKAECMTPVTGSGHPAHESVVPAPGAMPGAVDEQHIGLRPIAPRDDFEHVRTLLMRDRPGQRGRL